MSFRAKVATFQALFAHLLKSAELPEDVQALIGRLHWAEQQRNTFVHSMWDASETRPSCILRQKKAIRKGALRSNKEYMSARDFEELNALFEGIVTDLIYTTSQHFPKVEKKLL